MYLDDGIGIDPDEQLCQHIVNEVKIDLIKSGLVPKAEKSFWIHYGDKKCQHDDMLSEYRT
jgi:hypothetical protein